MLKGLAAAGVRTLVVDEAHHLRAEWWKSLMAARAALDGPIVVALTATPPYDVPPAEWERYKDLCGPIDAEISVPELVRAGDLCPHQDYVHVSIPTEEEARRIRGFRRDVEEFRRWLCADEGFVAALQAHPWVASPRAHMEEFLGEPEYASSMVVFLTGATGSPPAALLRVMGLPRRKVPALDLEWLEVLLTGVLYADRGRFGEHEEVMAEVQRRLSRVGAIERRKVRLRNTRQIARTLALSLSKVRSIDTILELEHSVLGDDLRMVVLTDYIRKADLPHGPDDVKPIRRMGVVPIFEHLRRQGHAGVRLGVLSGSLVIVPAGARGMLQSAAAEVGIGAGSLRAEPLKARRRLPGRRRARPGAPAHSAADHARLLAGGHHLPGRHKVPAGRGLGRARHQRTRAGQLRRLLHALQPDARAAPSACSPATRRRRPTSGTSSASSPACRSPARTWSCWTAGSARSWASRRPRT